MILRRLEAILWADPYCFRSLRACFREPNERRGQLTSKATMDSKHAIHGSDFGDFMCEVFPIKAPTSFNAARIMGCALKHLVTRA